MLLERVKLLCKEHNITLHKLEMESGIANGTLHKWTENNCKAGTLAKVAAYFDVTMDYLFLGVNGESRNFVRVEKVIPDEYKDICTVMSRLNEEGRDAVLAVAEGLVMNPKYKKGRNTSTNSADA